MSIASEIQRLSGVRSDIFTSITNKGVTVPGSATLSSCPALIASIAGGGGGGGAFTLDYTNPNQDCTFGTNPDCARSGTTITPVYTLTNNYILDNLTLNGNNIQGNSFSMPATNSTVGMVVRQIYPIRLKIMLQPNANDGHLYMNNLRFNEQVPTIMKAILYDGWGEYELNESEISDLTSEMPWEYYHTYLNSDMYLEIYFAIDTFDTNFDYITWKCGDAWENIQLRAQVLQDPYGSGVDDVLATLDYTQDDQSTFRIPEN